MSDKKSGRFIIRPFPVRYVRNTALRRVLLLAGTPILFAFNIVLVVVWTVPRLLVVHMELFASIVKYWYKHETREETKREPRDD